MNGLFASLRRRPAWLVDVLIVLVMAALLAVELQPLYASTDDELGPYRSPDTFAALHLAGVGVALLFRRRFPLTVLGTVLGLSLIYQAFEYVPLAVIEIAALVALFSGAAYARHRIVRPVAFAFIGLWLLAVSGLALSELSIGNIVILYVIYVGAWMLGERERTQRLYAAALAERNVLLARQNELELEQVVAAERTRIARELHDVIAHGLGVVVVQAEAALFNGADERPDVRRALEAIRGAGRSALAETRRVLGVMHDPGTAAGGGPAPGVADLPRLVQDFAAAGLDIDLVVSGSERPLDPGVDLSVYRVVEEALTNTLRHAEAQRVTVTLAFAARELDVLVRDDGQGAVAAPAGGGHGLVGMRERIAMLHGTFEAGPDPRGGYVVHASVPLGDCS